MPMREYEEQQHNTDDDKTNDSSVVAMINEKLLINTVLRMMIGVV